MTTPAYSYSAILTTFNAQETVLKALRSIYLQEIPPLEIIVVDDCSSDATVKLIMGVRDYPIEVKLFKNEFNRGQSWNRNYAAQMSQGDILIFFDDDDESLASRSTTHFQHFNSHADLSYVSSKKIYSTAYQIEHLNSVLKNFRLNIVDSFRLVFFGTPLNGNSKVYIPSSTLAVKKEAFLEIGGFDESLRRLEDVDLFLRASLGNWEFSWSDEICVHRYHSLGIDKNMGQDSRFEKVLISRYGSLVDSKLMKRARLLGYLRQVYFTKNYWSLVGLILRNPSILPMFISKLKVLIARRLHERKIYHGR
jgi:glycosyltransferase involved in cell wall biosynthesis